MKYIATVDDKQFEIEINTDDMITADGEPLSVDFQSVAGRPVYSLIIDGQSYEAFISPTETGLEVLLQGRLFLVDVEDERQRRLRQASGTQTAKSGEYSLKAPMPGQIVAIPIKEGEKVERGDNVIVLESMKMQNELKAPRDGTVVRLRVKTGDNVEQNQVLAIIN